MTRAIFKMPSMRQGRGLVSATSIFSGTSAFVYMHCLPQGKLSVYMRMPKGMLTYMGFTCVWVRTCIPDAWM